MDNQQLYFVGTVADMFNVSPREISDLFYRRKLDCEICKVSYGRRMIPHSYLPEVKKALIAYGSLTAEKK